MDIVDENCRNIVETSNDPLNIEIENSNPWSVEDVSAFLNYCCPECDYKDQNLEKFSSHALKSHVRSNVFFRRHKRKQKFHDIRREDYDPEPEYFSESPSNSKRVKETDYFDSDQMKNDENIDLIDEKPIDDTVADDTESMPLKIMKTIVNDRNLNFRCCPYCDYKHRNGNFIYRHIDSKHPESGSKKLSCDDCDMQFIFHSTFKFHMLQKHSINMFTRYGSTAAMASPLEFEFDAKLNYKMYLCPHCDVKLKMTTKVYIHIDAKHPDSSEKKFFCEHCDKGFIYDVSLKNHQLRKHAVEKHKKCPYCEYRVYDQRNMKRHIDIKHSENEPKNFSCEGCDRGFIYEETLTWHRRTSEKCSVDQRNDKNTSDDIIEKVPSPRPDCDDVCRTAPLLKTSDNVKKHCCEICNKAYHNLPKLKEHKLLKHPNLILEKAHGTEKMPDLFCEKCNFTTKMQNLLKAHIRYKHKVEKHKNRCPVLKKNIEKFHPKRGEKIFICDKCSRTFLYEQSFRKHSCQAEVEINTVPIECKACDKTFQKMAFLMAHMKRVHLGQKPFKCEHCTFETLHPSSLKYHVNTQHEKSRCKKCKKPLGDEEHICEGYGRPTHACDQCGRVFNSKNSLEMHYKTVHLKCKDFKCEYCGKDFATKSQLKCHISATHANHCTCEICGKILTNIAQFRRHKFFVHNDTKDFWVCEKCPDHGRTKSIFSSESGFQIHLKSDKHIKNMM